MAGALVRALPALALVLAAAALLHHSFAPRYARGMFATAPNAMVLPRVLLATIGLLACAVLVNEWRAPSGPAAGAQSAALRAWGLAAALTVAALALPHTGFAIMITALIPVCLLLTGERRPFVLLAVTAVTGPGLWYLFHHVLLIRLPSIVSGGAF